MSASLPDELNTFYARFESTSPAVEVQKAQEDHCPPVITRADVCRTLKRINTRKAPGPDGIPGRALKVCADQLADVFADIFNMSLLQSVVPTCFKETIIVPVPKKTKILSLNDYRPVALTSTIMKCFERCHRPHPPHCPLPPGPEGHICENAVSLTTVQHSTPSCPPSSSPKLRDLGFNRALCDWILNFLTSRPQAVRMGSTTSSTLTLNTGAPQGCVLSPLLYSLFTHDCVATHSSNTIIKFADNTTVIGLITMGTMTRRTAYREEVRVRQDNNLHLNVSKTKELIVDFRRRQREEHAPLSINGTTVERVNSFRFTWTHHTDFITKSARQQLFFLRRLRRLNMDSRILCSFYRCTIESILTGCITAWYSSCTALNRKALQRVVKAAQHITRTELPSMEDLYTQRCRKKATKIIKDPKSLQLQTVLPAAVWPTVLQHSSPNHQAQGQLHTAGHKTFKLCSEHHHFLITHHFCCVRKQLVRKDPHYITKAVQLFELNQKTLSQWKNKDRYVARIGVTWGPTLEPGLGLGLAGERLVAGSLPTRDPAGLSPK
ncbi:hypothetical protein L3Q82_009536 [Scortum barcoo]|uniref:Uncharacterized protein n=1 Tax=Scortum barcoo TaxID=214431 RepID=A0ACB8WJM9_9TELE|nr:hypothetical protein L3Q82_009536 [Scortum barcoo]